MWFGTKNGLNRYDGSSFKIFKPNSGNSISNEIINDIAEDSSGNIWVATMEGLNNYNPTTGRWQTIMPSSADMPKTLPNFLIWSLYSNKKKNLLWVASDVNDFSCYNISTKKFIQYDWPAYTQTAFPTMQKKYRSIQKFIPKSDHEFWIASNIGLFTFDISKGQFKFIGCNFDADITDLVYDQSGKCVYISTQDNHLFCYNETTHIYHEVSLQYQPYPSNHFIETKTGLKQSLIASSSGLAIITESGKASVLQNIPQFAPSLLPGGTNCIYKDDNDIDWIGTANGISKRDINSSTAFLPLIAVPDREAENKMGPVIYDAIDNKYYVCAQSSQELFVIDGRMSDIHSINTIEGKRLDGCICVKIDCGNHIWLLTENHVYLYNRSKKVFEIFKTPNGEERVTFRDVAQDADGNFWFAAFNYGIYCYNTTTKTFFRPGSTAEFFPSIVTSLLSDTMHRTVWVGTFSRGLYRYNLDKKDFTTFTESKENPEYLQLNLINDMYQDLNGRIWVATYSGGIYLYEDGKSHETCFRHLTMKTGLSNNSYAAINGDAGKIWLLSGKGMTVLDTSGNFIEDVSKDKLMSFSNYLSDARYPHYIFYNRFKKELLIAAGGGLIFYNPDQKTSVGNFPLLITDVWNNNVSLKSDSFFHINDVAAFPFGNNTLSIDFAGLRYTNNNLIKYEYQLSGNSEWIDAGDQHNIKFNNLQPGAYQLKIRSKDADGRINDSVAAFNFKIIPPFWRSWWFITAIALLLFYLLYKWNYSLRQKIHSEKILNYFATSLYGQNTIDDVFWDIAKNCISQLKFEDCVIYQYDNSRKMLLQKAAYGPKNPVRFEIINHIEIMTGKGIVGTVAQTGKAEVIGDTSKDNRYIVDDERRFSEITVPILIDGKVFGVIDSEHPRKNFYKKSDLWLLQKIAETCSTKISKYLIEERLRSKIARDLHDELGSNLTSINIISKVAMQQNINEQVDVHLKKIKEHSGKMMESMSDIVWAINPANDTAEKMMLRMKEYTAEMLEPLRINYFFYEEGALTETKLGLNERKDIFLIFKEAINNAVKYSEATEINIWIKKQDTLFILTVADNGKGFDPDKTIRGNGLNNMQSRAEGINASFKITSLADNGTSISLQLPITL